LDSDEKNFRQNPSLHKLLPGQHSWSKIAEHHQQRRLTSKNPGAEDEDPNQKKEVELDRPHVKKTTQQYN